MARQATDHKLGRPPGAIDGTTKLARKPLTQSAQDQQSCSSADLRAAELAKYGILDTPTEPLFDDMAQLAADLCEAPIAVVNFVDRDRQWFKAEVGIGTRELPLDVSICRHAILQPGLFVVPDLTQDERFANNPLVLQAGGLRFYAGALLETPDGTAIGTVCVLDTKPRPAGLSERQERMLKLLAQQVISELEMRRALAEASKRDQERQTSEDALRDTTRRLNAIINNTMMAVFVMDEHQQCVFMNKAAEQLTGYTLDETSGRPLHDVVHHTYPDGRPYPLHECPIDRAFPERNQVQGEELFIHKDGHFYPVAFTASPIRNESGEPIGTIIEARDIADERAQQTALRETEERYRLAARATNDAIWDWDLIENRILWNEALQTAYGHPLEQISDAGEWWIEQIHPEDRERVDKSIHAVIDGADLRWTEEYRFRRADGSYAEVFDRGQIIRDESGKAVRMIGAMLDLTDRKAAERELEERQRLLRESEERFRQLTELAPAIIWFGNSDGTLRYLNPYWYNFTGQTSEEALPHGWAAVIHPDDAPALEQAWFDARDRGSFYEIEARLRKHDGTYRWFLIRAEPLHHEDGFVTGWLGHDIDIHDRKVAEEAVAELNTSLENRVDEALAERRLWAEIFESTDATIAILDPAYQLMGLNTAYADEVERLFGVRPRRGDNILKLLDGQPERDLARDLWSRALAGETFSVVAQVGAPEESSHYEVRFDSLRDAKGRIFAAFQYGINVTERLDEQRRLREAEESLRQVQKMEAVGQLTGGIAHDFNNLLTGIIGSLDFMQQRIQQGRSVDIERYVRMAMSSANRAASLTHRLLAFSRRQPLDPKPVNADRLVSGMEELLRRTIGERVHLEIVTAAGLWPTLCDPNQLENAILNLAINARDAMPDGGTLTIETSNARLDHAYVGDVPDLKPGQYICLAVTDTGTGMPPDVISRAFEPFFTTKPIGQGTGLGLSMIYGFARQSEGHARIYSEVGQGTTFKLYLPRHFGDEQPEESFEGQLKQEHRAEAGEIVLVVEDEHAVRDLVVEVLRELGYGALEAVDGPSGLELLRSDARIDLVVSDVGLPGINGRQLADEARRLRPGLKVLFMTGYAESAVIASGFLEPGMEMITKPFALEALAARIRNMVESD